MSVISSLEVAATGEIWTSVTVGGLFVATTVSVIVRLVVDQESPLFPLPPFAAIPAISTTTDPLPAEGAVQSNVHARFALFV